MGGFISSPIWRAYILPAALGSREQLKAAAIPTTRATSTAAHQVAGTETTGKEQKGPLSNPLQVEHTPNRTRRDRHTRCQANHWMKSQPDVYRWPQSIPM